MVLRWVFTASTTMARISSRPRRSGVGAPGRLAGPASRHLWRVDNAGSLEPRCLAGRVGRQRPRECRGGGHVRAGTACADVIAAQTMRGVEIALDDVRWTSFLERSP